MILLNRLNPFQYLFRQFQIRTGNVAVQLLQACRANDVAGHERLLRHKRQRHLRRVQPMLPRQCNVAAACRFRLRVEVTAEAAVFRQSRFRWAGAILIFAAEHAERQGRIRQQAALLANRDFRQAHFKAAVEQVVGVLDRHRTRPATGFGQGEELHGAPRRFVGQADVADLAGLHLLIQRFEGFFQRGEVVFVLVLVAQLAEEVGTAFRPVQLVEVDPVGLQALEAGVQGFDDVLAVVAQVTVADVIDGVAGASDLAGEDPVGTVATALEVITDVALDRKSVV